MTATYGTFGSPSRTQGLVDTTEDPIFVPANVHYNGKEWYRVGIRFKGNSSLQSAWQSGILKLSFKLDFDEYEDNYPQIKNQRFYGFKKFSLKNNYGDASLMREKVSADVFKSAGLAVSHTAFYTLYIDHGNGAEYFGLYTLVEEVDGEVIDTQFSSNKGNLYKPEEGSANFVENTFNQEDFEKKTNEDDADWSDIESLFTALHSTTRTDNAPTWRINLESVFDVPVFLKYLAVNGIIQNWDTYGRMAHNFYLYNNPDNNKLTWIPWDNNEALQKGKMGGALALDFSNLSSDQWPLIAKIIADEEYKAQYKLYLQEVIESAFQTTKMQETYDTYAELIRAYAIIEVNGYSFLGNNKSSEFTQAVADLKSHASDRATAVENYLKQ
jgi:spore coat protein CotH